MRYLLALFLLADAAFAQDNKFADYLKTHKAAIDVNLENQWRLLKTDAGQSQFIILGESHGAQATQSIDFNLLQYLNRVAGTRNYVAELDLAQSASINQYLKTGDETYLKPVFRTWVKRHAQWGNSDFYEKIVRIRALNQTLPEDKRILFTGIDQVQDFQLYLAYLNKFIQHKHSPLLDSIRLVSATNLDETAFEYTCAFAKRLVEKIKCNRSEFAKLLGGRLPIFEYLIKNLSHSDNASASNRPEYLFENFRQLYSALHWENEKLYGMWGFFHSHQVPIYFVGEDFASRLVGSDLPISKKVITILCFPIDSKFNVWDAENQTWVKKPFSYDDKNLLSVDGIEDVKALSAGDPVALFKIDGDGSPFAGTGRLFNGASPQGRLVGDFRKRSYAYQYLVVFRHSDWLHPLPSTF